jgi:hypothetical protein
MFPDFLHQLSVQPNERINLIEITPDGLPKLVPDHPKLPGTISEPSSIIRISGFEYFPNELSQHLIKPIQLICRYRHSWCEIIEEMGKNVHHSFFGSLAA